GLGNAFSSKLILHENATYTPQNIQTILGDFMGIQQLILLDTLWYDIIHHVDMHMKLLDEETMMVGQYPLNTADGPQIEANLQYILSNFVNPYGKPYRIIRIPMPPENGQFPNNGGDYRTYTNTVFVNNTILVPTYNSPYDSAALQIWQHNMKGYNVRGIDCNAIIPQRGALHCITKEVGTSDPIWITFEKFDSIVPHNENGYPFRAKIKHKTGIASASLYYQTEKRSLFQELPLNLQEENIYTAIIPPQNEGTTINYYVGAVANNGKQAQRPMTSPEGALQFQIEETSNAIVIQTANTINVYPNPAKAVTCIEWESLNKQAIEINLTDVLGTKMETIFQGNPFGKNRFFFNTANYPSGIYFINIFENNNFITAAKIVIR
ncbi:MAG: agmatine deiminase family protein, partial [Saprospiraceae bacterium]